MRYLIIALAFATLSGCASMSPEQFTYGRGGVQTWGQVSGDNWSVSW
jgi:uncharacterized protein YceK